jgi:hypothetical protein
MGHGAHTKYRATMASGGTLTSEIDLGRAWGKVYLDPTGAASEVRLQAAASTGGTFRQVYHPSINSSTVGANIFKIPSSVSGGLIELPAGLRFIKVETTAAVADGGSFTLICSDF